MSTRQRELNNFVLRRLFSDGTHLTIPLSNEGIHYWIIRHYRLAVTDNWTVDFCNRFFCDFNVFFERCFNVHNAISTFNLSYYAGMDYKKIYQEKLFKRFCNAIRYYIYKVYSCSFTCDEISGMQKYITDFCELEPVCSRFDLVDNYSLDLISTICRFSRYQRPPAIKS